MTGLKTHFTNKLRYGSRPWRWAKTLFFVLTMLASLLLVSASPVPVIVLDFLLPPVLYAATRQSSLSISAICFQLKSFSLHSSLIDLPLVSIGRSLIILVAYVVCPGHLRLYMGITTSCSAGSIGYVLLKILNTYDAMEIGDRSREGLAIEALLLCSIALGIGHVVVAYRTSCRERRKLLVYKIDIEAVKMKGSPKKEDGKL